MLFVGRQQKRRQENQLGNKWCFTAFRWASRTERLFTLSGPSCKILFKYIMMTISTVSAIRLNQHLYGTVVVGQYSLRVLMCPSTQYAKPWGKRERTLNKFQQAQVICLIRKRQQQQHHHASRPAKVAKFWIVTNAFPLHSTTGRYYGILVRLQCEMNIWKKNFDTWKIENNFIWIILLKQCTQISLNFILVFIRN